MYKEPLFNRILALSMQGLLYHCVFCMFCDVLLPYDLPPDLFLPALFAPLFLFSIIRNKCDRFLVFILLHAAAAGSSMLFVSIPQIRLVTGICTGVMFILSMRFRLNPLYQGQEACPPAVYTLLFLFIYIIAQFNEREQLMRIIYYETVLYLILYAVYKCFDRTDRFITSNREISNFPLKQMKSLIRIFLCIFILFLVTGMSGMQKLPFDHALAQTGALCLMILRSILKLIARLLGNSTTLPETPAQGSRQPEAPFLAAEEVSPFLQILEQLLKAALYILIAYFLIRTAIRILYEIYKRFYEHTQTGHDESEFIWKNPVVKEKLKHIYKKKEPEDIKNTSYKVRRIYKKYVRKQFGRKSVIPACMTPSELEACLAEAQLQSKNPSQRQSENLVQNMSAAKHRLEIYEKARYSQWECSRQELEHIKLNIREQNRH